MISTLVVANKDIARVWPNGMIVFISQAFVFHFNKHPNDVGVMTGNKASVKIITCIHRQPGANQALAVRCSDKGPELIEGVPKLWIMSGKSCANARYLAAGITRKQHNLIDSLLGLLACIQGFFAQPKGDDFLF